MDLKGAIAGRRAVREYGRARATLVKIGHRNSRMVEVLAGLSPGVQVVVHPSDRVSDGTRVAQRPIQ